MIYLQYTRGIVLILADQSNIGQITHSVFTM